LALAPPAPPSHILYTQETHYGVRDNNMNPIEISDFRTKYASEIARLTATMQQLQNDNAVLKQRIAARAAAQPTQQTPRLKPVMPTNLKQKYDFAG